MSLKSGTWLAHYEILDHIGSGGMGEVYRARDNKLQREVALKVLPEQFARDPERVARFRREAQVLAQLNHTNIAAIYSVEQTGDTHFLVMELVLGETLRDRIQRGPVPIEESLDIAKQIATGLEAAHEKPIVHRDLKPANVKVTPEGVVKILDFGLARAFSGDTGSGDPADSPTLTGMTQPGTILGTAAYMSPEQARGKTVDKRTDIWALGCVLYELLTGKRAFDGEDVTEILGAIHHKEPDWSALPEATSPAVRTLLRRCLQKDAKRRSRDASEIQLQIEETLTAPAPETVTVTKTAPLAPLWRRAMPWAAAFALGLLIAGFAVWNLRSVPPPTVTRFFLTLPPTQQMAYPVGHMVALSLDGTRLVYAANDQLYLRAMGELDSAPIRGTENGGISPFFSPDGQWLGFWQGGELKKVPIRGGPPVTLCEVRNLYGANWGADDTIVFGEGPDGLWQVPAGGGAKQRLVAVDSAKGELGHGPQILPGGKTVLFTVGMLPNWDDGQIVAQDLETGERQVLIEGGTDGRFVPTGHLVYVREGTLLAVPFDPRRLAVTGGPVPIVEGILQQAGFSSPTGSAQFSFSSNGSLVYVPRDFLTRPPTNELVWMDRQGTVEPVGAPARFYMDPRVSPNGQRLAIRIPGGPGDPADIWIYEISRNTLTRLTFEGNNTAPSWTPDGSRVAFRSNRGGTANVFWKPVDGSGPAERLMTSDNVQTPNSWTSDGRFLAFYERPINQGPGSRGGRDIWVLPMEGERKPQPFVRTPFDEGGAGFSPDGRWLAYTSDESGRFDVYVQPFPGPGAKLQISAEGGMGPVWRADGRELFYTNGNQIMAVVISTVPSFRAGTPKMLFEGVFEPGGVGRADYDVTPDGQRFLMIREVSENSAVPQEQISVVLNWFEELKQRVPVP